MKRNMLFVALVLVITALFVTPIAAQDDPDLLIWADRTRTPALTAAAEQFSADFGVTVEVQEIGMGDIRANLGVVGPTGEGPDIIIAAHDWIGELVLNGSVRPIDLGDAAELFTPASLSLFTYNGELYGVPYAVENVAFFRNTDLVPEAPATWAEVKEISEQLVSSGASEHGYVIQTSDFYHFFPIVSAFGGYIFGRDDAGNYDPTNVGIDSEGTIAAGAWLQSMVEAGLIPDAIDYDVMHAMFEQGDAAMIVTGPWALPRIRQSGVPYAISDIPAGDAGPGQPMIGGQGFMISAYTEDALLAEAFLIDFMATESAMQAMYDVDPRPPAFVPLLETLADPDLEAFQSAGLVGVPQPSIPEMSSVWGAAANAQQFIIQGDLPADEAFLTAGEQIRTLIAGGEIEAVAASTVGDTPPEDGPQAVSIPGTVNSAMGCAGDWDPACAEAQLAYTAAGDVWQGTFVLAAGEYEYKVALDGAWDENYGANAERDGANVALSLAEETPVTFIYDNKTHWVMDNVNFMLLTAPGDYQDEIGCEGDWQPNCLRSLLQDADGDGVYSFTVNTLPAGDYQAKAAQNMAWDINWGVDGARDGANITFTVPADNAEVTFSFDSSSSVLTVEVAG
ncbi:MAG: extracellular solute-binding protein [Chloroflexi bacterium]|nr:extracellular solute-binding protein [Chloroflexota bacterium]